MTENEIVGWHHQLDDHEFEQALGVGDGQGSLARCSPWGCKELDTTEQLTYLLLYMTGSLCCTPETNTTLCINSTSIKKLKKSNFMYHKHDA